MNKKKNYETQKRLAKAAIGNPSKGAYYDEAKGRYVRIDKDPKSNIIKKLINRITRRKLNSTDVNYPKGSIYTKLNKLD